MRLVETKFYAQLVQLADYILIGLLWVVVSLPIITIIPASTAVLYVLRQWQGGSTGSIFHHFFMGGSKHFVANLLLSSFSFILLTLVKTMMLENTHVLVVAGYVVTMIWLMFLFSWMDNCSREEQSSIRNLFKICSLEILVNFLRNAACCLLLVLFVLLIFLFPPFIFIFAGGFWKGIKHILFRKRQVKL